MRLCKGDVVVCVDPHPGCGPRAGYLCEVLRGVDDYGLVTIAYNPPWSLPDRVASVSLRPARFEVVGDVR